MVGIRVAMFVILSNVLELFVAHCAIERSKGFDDLRLNIRSASDVVLSSRQQLSHPTIHDYKPLFPRVGLHSP